MPSKYKGISSANLDCLIPLEDFLDVERNKMSYDLHYELADIYEEMNERAAETLKAYEELEQELLDLKAQS